MTKIISTAEFKRHIPKYCRAAERETIIITLREEATHVLISIHEYNRLIYQKHGLKLAK